MFADTPVSWMFPSEAAVVAGACAERRREFGTVRYCARRALRRIDMPALPILPDADGTPRWPVGVVGSMTHCRGYRAAVVARSQTLRGIGIDAEPDAALPPAMLDLVLRGEERARLQAMSEAVPGRHWDSILFCAKEAVFKTWFPIARSWLDFPDVSVTVRANGAFRAIVHASRVVGVGPAFDGRWAVANGLILTATSVSPSKQDAVEPSAHGDDRVWRKNLPEALR